MRRWVVAGAAALCAAMLAAPARADPPPHARGHDRHARGHDHPGRVHGRHARGHQYDWRTYWRHDNGLHRGWDRRRYNGYTYRGVWRYGPPPARLQRVVLGHRPWRRGMLLPAYYRSSLVVVDPRAYHLAPAPRGYQYVRDDRGDYLLVGVASGAIIRVIAAG